MGGALRDNVPQTNNIITVPIRLGTTNTGTGMEGRVVAMEGHWGYGHPRIGGDETRSATTSVSGRAVRECPTVTPPELPGV